MNPLRILITGASGFLGQHLLEELRNDNFIINAIIRGKTDNLWASNKKFDTFRADISDKDSLDKAFKNIDIVVHLAAERNFENYYFASNVTGVMNLIELAKKHKIKKIIHLSSISVFGMKNCRKKIMIGDSFPCIPYSGYGKSKLESERLFNKLSLESNIGIIILRSAAMFGEQQPEKYLDDLFNRVNSRVNILRHKNSFVNFVYVKDVAHAIRFFLKNETENKTITIGESVPFKNFVAIVSHQLGVSCNVLNVPPFVFDILNVVNYFGIKQLKSKFESISNCVAYDDSFMKNVVKYKYGLAYGISITRSFYHSLILNKHTCQIS